MSDIDNVIDTLDLRGHGNVIGGMIIRARAELAQLRATVAAQAEQLREAREIIETCASLDRYVADSGIEDARAWLAANAPQAPEEQSA